MIRFLVDENVPLASARRLHSAGHDVARAVPGQSDLAILQVARDEGRIIVTHDRDFGFLVFRERAPVPSGVVFFRTPLTTPESTALSLLSLMAIREIVLEGRLTVVEPGRIRQRPLPPV